MLLAAFSLHAADVNPTQPEMIQHGKMHEVIGQQQHQGRVVFADLLKRPGFCGVAAVEGLRGEATILDGKLTITTVDAEGKLKPTDNATDTKAAMLIGAYVNHWAATKLQKETSADDLDKTIQSVAESSGLDPKRAFPFVIEGEFTDVRLHVINGACPIRARMKVTAIPAEIKPFESTLKAVSGTLVGVFAKDAVGNVTHPGTMVHVHLIYTDPQSGRQVTGHVESVGLAPGVTLKLPR